MPENNAINNRSSTLTVDNTCTVTAGDLTAIAGNINVGTTTPANPARIAIEESVAGSTGISVQNPSTNANASSVIQLITEPNAADPRCNYVINGGQNWSVGIDNSDADAFKITTASSPSGGTTVLSVSTGLAMSMPATSVTMNGGQLDFGTGVADDAINIGTNANAGRGVTIGNTTGTSTINIDYGSGGLNLPVTEGALVSSSGGSITSAAPGSSGQVLTSNGAGSAPTFQSASAGSLVLLQTQSASGADVRFTSTFITTTYKNYYIVFRDMINNSAGANLQGQLSTNNGSSYLSTNYFSGLLFNTYNSATLTNIFATSFIQFTPNNNLSTTQGWSGYMYITGLQQSSAGGPTWYGESFAPGSGGAQTMIRFSGKHTGSSIVNNIRIYPNAGSWSSGTISLYGIAE